MTDLPSILKAAWQLICGIANAARNGQCLPLLTVLLAAQLPAVIIVTNKWGVCASNDPTSTRISDTAQNQMYDKTCHFIVFGSIGLLCINLILICVGYMFLLQLYQHSIKNIFNRKLPATLSQCIPSFVAHLSLLRPLEILLRRLTYRQRVLPDIVILGEVRCGTTSLASHLMSLSSITHERIFCQAPFCLWAHPELDRKETFYFVGHYLQNVTPKYYSSCFPLLWSRKWMELRSKLCRCFGYSKVEKAVFTFDGCAQYLTSPSAPYLLAKAYKDADLPPPILIACVRDPREQTKSWFRYESNAMQWGNEMGLTEWNSKLRGMDYPPNTIQDALQYSLKCEDQYVLAESLAKDSCEASSKPQDWVKGTKSVSMTRASGNIELPEWAMTWPGGQMSGVGRNAKFVDNINRYEHIFQKSFSSKSSLIKDGEATTKTKKDYGTENKLRYVDVLPITHLSDPNKLKVFLVDILKKVAYRRHGSRKDQDFVMFLNAVKTFEESSESLVDIHRNATTTSSTFKVERNDSNEKFYLLEEEKLKELLTCNGVVF